MTAVDPERAGFLGEAAASVRQLRVELDAEWIVVWDGEAKFSVGDANVVVEGLRYGGVSATRNLALSHISSNLTTVLDADDVIVEDGCVSATNAFRENPGLGWIGLSRTFMDGIASQHTLHSSETFLAGELSERWSAPFLFHPNSIMVKTSLLRSVGGWPALRSNEDLGMALSVSELAPGQTLSETITRYRVWEQQEVAKSEYSELKQSSFKFIESVINSRRADFGRKPIFAPRDTGGAYGRKRFS